MSPGSIRVRVTVTVDSDDGRASASSVAQVVRHDFAVGELSDWAATQAKRRVIALVQKASSVEAAR